MKTFFIMIILCFVCSHSFAEKVYFKKDTGEVVFTASCKDVVVINDSNISFVDIKNLGDIDGQISDYKVSGNRIVLDNKKINDRNTKIEKAFEKEESKKIMRKSAEDKLKALGLTEDDVKALFEKE